MQILLDRDEKPVVEKEVRLDSSNRVTLPRPRHTFYAMKQYANGTIVLEPRVLVHPEDVSRRTLQEMDVAMRNLKNGRASERVSLSADQRAFAEEDDE
ncbi:hypothetical protein BH24GEM2_BH24GEM2_18570 [soil metagenome]|jgi:hypothetical protein